MPSQQARRPRSRRFGVPLLALLLSLGASACNIFDDGSDEQGEETETGPEQAPWPPEQGFRVLPKYLLQDIPAIVTLDVEGEAQPCLLDTQDGGYLCDTSAAPGPTALVQVERDGFEPATRTPTIPNGLEELAVHLYVEGGPTTQWSACVGADEFVDCLGLCEAQALGCVPASCPSDDESVPVASARSFADLDCLMPALAPSVTACEEPLAPPSEEIMAYQCCCTG